MKTTMDITVFRRENLRRDPLELFEHDGNYESIVRATSPYLGATVMEWRPNTNSDLLDGTVVVSDDVFDVAKSLLRWGAESPLLEKVEPGTRTTLEDWIARRGTVEAVERLLEDRLIIDW